MHSPSPRPAASVLVAALLACVHLPLKAEAEFAPAHAVTATQTGMDTPLLLADNDSEEEYLGEEILSTEQWVQRLQQRDTATAAPQSRSMGLSPELGQYYMSQSLHSKPHKAKAHSMVIPFEYGSARLSSRAKTILQPLRDALEQEVLRHQRFVVEGHTDSKGDAEYNQWLSEQRAQAVKEYLSNNLTENRQRLKALGRGESKPLYKADPANPANRRVSIQPQ